MHSHLGARFRGIREKAGLTQAQVARYLNVDQSYISKFEKGERQFRLDLLARALTLCGCTLDALTDAGSEIMPIAIALRASQIEDDDLEAIATINRLALNLQYMKGLLGGEEN